MFCKYVSMFLYYMPIEVVCLILVFLFMIMSVLGIKRQPEECIYFPDFENPPPKVFAKINHKKTEVSRNWQLFLNAAPLEERPTFNSRPWNDVLKHNYKQRSGQISQTEQNRNGSNCLQGNSSRSQPASNFGQIVKSDRLTKHVAMDCEMVGDDDNGDMLARVSIVNKFGECIYDKYVKPTQHVADYRTWVSGIRPRDLQNGESLQTVQKEVADIIKGRILVGHAIRNDLKVLFLSHPHRMIRDTQRFQPFKTLTKSKRPSLKKLAAQVLGVEIQGGEHSSVEDAKATMQLYQLYQKQWEKEISMRMKSRRPEKDNS